MKETRVESLLQQMSLMSPSAALDQRIETCLSSSPQTTSVVSARWGTWGLLSAVAVASLVIGVIAGHRIASTSAAVVDSTDGTAIDLKTTIAISPNKDSPPSAEKTAVVVTADMEELFAQLQGPNVTMLCTMKDTAKMHITQEEQCLVCHAGLSAAGSRFRTEHMQLPAFATCMWCHDTSMTE